MAKAPRAGSDGAPRTVSGGAVKAGYAEASKAGYAEASKAGSIGAAKARSAEAPRAGYAVVTGAGFTEAPKAGSEPEPFQIDDFYRTDGTLKYKKASTCIQSFMQKIFHKTTLKELFCLNFFVRYSSLYLTINTKKI